MVKRVASLHLRKYREREGAFLVEGVDLVMAGLAAGLRPQAVCVVEGTAAVELAAPGGPLAGLPVHLVTSRVAAKMTTLQTPPEVLVVFPLPSPPPLATLRAPGLVAVYADRIADPGNMGTLVRAAAAFAAAALATSPGSVDLFSPKVVRAGMGAVFALPLYSDVTLPEFRGGLAAEHVYGLVAHGGADLRAASLATPAVVCVGAERAGLGDEVTAALTGELSIALESPGGTAVESLNAGVAGAIALYEFSRRRAGDATATETNARRSPAPGEE